MKGKTVYEVEEFNEFKGAKGQWVKRGDTTHRTPASAVKRARGILKTYFETVGTRFPPKLRVVKVIYTKEVVQHVINP